MSFHPVTNSSLMSSSLLIFGLAFIVSGSCCREIKDILNHDFKRSFCMIVASVDKKFVSLPVYQYISKYINISVSISMFES